MCEVNLKVLLLLYCLRKTLRQLYNPQLSIVEQDLSETICRVVRSLVPNAEYIFFPQRRKEEILKDAKHLCVFAPYVFFG